ncbi:MAG: branched-chain amino acid ABC transporter permease [Chloroflexi bacterium]|nr:branched-chain amino acid ABC transporter permease [Chloroflexota bacterium]
MVTLVQVVVSGLLLGGVYALLAGGLTLIFGVMRVINLAHGEFLMLGAYASFFLFVRLGLNPILSLLLSMPLMFGVGWIAQRLLISRVDRAPLLASLLLTYGVSLALTGGAQATFTNDFRSVPFLSGALNIGELAFSVPRLVACVTALLLTGAAQFFLARTRWGKALRATAQSADVALACGIDIDRARMIAFGIATALAGAAGTLTSFLYTIYPEMGKTFMLKAFAVIVLGGMGSFPGAFLGALALGVIESTASYVTTTQIAEAVIYITLLAMLLLRPQGFFGLKEA